MRVIIFTTYMVPENLQVYVKTYAEQNELVNDQQTQAPEMKY